MTVKPEGYPLWKDEPSPSGAKNELLYGNDEDGSKEKKEEEKKEYQNKNLNE